MRLINIKFLMLIWNHTCSEGDYVCLAVNSLKKNWRDFSFKYDEDLEDNLAEWFEAYPPKKYDLYFCPLPYSKKRRNSKDVNPLNILWADIDEGDSYRVEPTLLWESSPNRYQGLWFLDKKSEVLKVEKLNKDLAYYIGADKGGWDLTQVLRIPGTRNHKYDDTPKVKSPDYTEEIFSYKELRKQIPSSSILEKKPEHSKADIRKILKKYSSKIPAKIQRTLLAKKIMGDRSKVLWKLENDLFEYGLPREVIFSLVKQSAWNKFKGRRDEEKLLNRELDNVEERHSNRVEDTEEDYEEEEEIPKTSFLIDSYEGLLSSLDTYPGWLVEGFWLKGSHGIVAGEPKSFKSTLSLDFAISVASGRNFLGKYEVHNQGPVIYIQNENSKWIMKDRIEKIAYSKGLGGRVRVKNNKIRFRPPEKIPLHFINTQSYLLNNEEHRAITEEVIRQYKPKLIVFDPLYLMYDGDLNAAKELNPILGWLLGLKNRFNCAIMLIHHYNKGNGNNATSRGGQRMLGSTTLHGWIESAWYVKTEEEEGKESKGEEVNKAETQTNIIIDREFRGAGAHPRIDLSLSMGSIDSSQYSVDTKVHQGAGRGNKSDLNSIDARVLNFLLAQKEDVSMRYIAQELGISRTIIRQSIERLIQSKAVKEEGRGKYSIY